MTRLYPGDMVAEMRESGERIHPGYVAPQLLVGLLVFGTLFIGAGDATTGPVTAGSRIAPVDLGMILAFGAAVLRYARWPSTNFNQVLQRILPPVAILFGLQVAYVALGSLSATPVVVDAFGLLYLIVPLALLLIPQGPPGTSILYWSIAVSSGVLGIISLVGAAEGTGRGTGTFTNPNHTGSWAALAFVVLLAGFDEKRRRSRPIVLILLLSVLLMSNSYAALGGLAGAVVYMTVRGGLGLRVLRRFVVGTVLLLAAMQFLPSVSASLPTDPTARWERSTQGRQAFWTDGLVLWLDNPMGVGPGRALVDSTRSLHNDFMTALVALGIPGLLLLLWLLWAIWKSSGAMGHATLIVVVVLMATHDAFSWRHMWLFLAIAIASDRKGETPEHIETRRQYAARVRREKRAALLLARLAPSRAPASGHPLSAPQPPRTGSLDRGKIERDQLPPRNVSDQPTLATRLQS